MAGDADATLSDRFWEEFRFSSGESSEKEEDATLIFLGDEPDYIIGKCRPELHMASRVSLFHSEGCVEKKDALFNSRPSGQISRGGF